MILHTELRAQVPRVLLDDDDEVETDKMKEEKEMMFYVHYEKLDRRNDEWVTLDRYEMKLEHDVAH